MEFRKLLANKISLNATAILIRTVLQIIIAFVGNYYLVRLASKEEIGMWALIFVFSGFLQFVDFGLSQALIRYVANDADSRYKYFWVTLQSYFLFGLLGILILLGINEFLGFVFFGNNETHFLILLLGLLGFYFSLLGTACTNTFNGLQKMGFSSLVEVFKGFGFYFITLILYPKLGFVAFGWGYFISNILSFILASILLFSQIKLPFYKFDLIIFKKLSGFGIKVFGVQVVNLIKGSWLKILTSNMFSLEYVAYMDFTERVIGYFRQLLLSFILPLMPAAADFHGQKQFQKLNKLYKLSLLILFSLGLVITLGFIILIPWFIRFWLGENYLPVILASQLLSLSVFFNMLTGPGTSILQAINRQKPVVILAFLTLIIFLSLTTLVALRQGFYGIFIGNSIAEAVATFCFILWFYRRKPICE